MKFPFTFFFDMTRPRVDFVFQYIYPTKNEILVLKTKHSILICSFSCQYTLNFNCFYLYIIAQIQLDSSKSSREGYTYIWVYHF